MVTIVLNANESSYFKYESGYFEHRRIDNHGSFGAYIDFKSPDEVAVSLTKEIER